MSVKNWSFSYKREKKKEWKQNILDTISLWGAIGLLWFSFISIIVEHFPEIGMDWWMIGLFVFVLWLGYDWPKNYLKRLVLPCRVAGIMIPVAYAVANFQKIVDGFWYLASLYLPFLNDYYQTSIYFAEVGEKDHVTVAFTAIGLLLWWFVWRFAYAWKKRVLLVLFPSAALALELMVGLSPRGDGLFYMFIAAMLLILLGGTSVIKKIVVMACVCGSMFLVGISFAEDMKELATQETKQNLLQWQNNLSMESFNPLKWLQIDMHFHWEPLNNSTPQYTGKTVLTLEMDESPVGRIYLKGFYGTNYDNGSWTYDDSAFRAACKDANKNTKETAQHIFQMPYSRWEQKMGDLGNIAFQVKYTGTTGDVAYAPYGTSYDSLDADYKLMGDYLLKKSIVDSKIEGIMQNVDFNSSMTLRSMSAAIQKGLGNYSAGEFLSYWYEAIEIEETPEEMEFYNGLADAYLKLPTDMNFLSEDMEQLEAYIQSALDDFLYQTEGENYYRLICSDQVTEYLEKQMSYSLQLDNLPMGKDPIDYAMHESHEGYCMHFASAATLLLRGLDVPARYVSGYAVAPSSFEFDEGTGLYKAEVGDFMAHAWVEIYLDNIGWVPVDPTPGSNLDELPSDEQIDQWESASNENRQDIMEQEPAVEPENTEIETEQTEVETQDSESVDTEADTQIQTESGENGTDIPSGDNDTKKFDFLQVLKGLGIFGGIVAAGFLCVRAIRYGLSRFELSLKKDMEKNLKHRVVKRINRRLYHVVRLTRICNWFQRKWSDAQYRDALVECFNDVSEEEWDKFMDIVKKNHYSHETISAEEMQYCYECYKKAKQFNISLTKLWENKK